MATVLFTIRDMSKLFIEANFIQKLYKEYDTHKRELSRHSTMDNLLLNKISLPFFLLPISLLQEINVTLQYHKKINKNSPPTHIFLTLMRESINTQLIEAEYFKKNKFRNDWPYNGQVSLLNVDEEFAAF